MREGKLRLLHPATGVPLPTLEEAEAARQQEHAARAAAEAENTRLRAELARLRGSKPES